MKALILKTDGTVIEKDFAEGQSYDLISEGVDGMIECVSLSEHIDMWVNEEGKLIDLPVNHIATVMWEQVFGRNTDVIVGDVVFTGGTNDQGDTLGLRDKELSGMLRVFALASAELQNMGVFA